MNIPIEVWALIPSYLELNDLIEVSCFRKDLCHLSKINNFFVKILNESRYIFRSRSWFFFFLQQLLRYFLLQIVQKTIALCLYG